MGSTSFYRRNFGPYDDARAYDIAVGEHGYVHIIGEVAIRGHELGDPVGPFYSGGKDGFYARLDETGNLVYFSYLGGDEDDRGYSLVLADNRCVYLGLETWSNSLNVNLPGAPQDTHAGASDVLILRHCDSGDPGSVNLSKTANPGIVEPGEVVTFEIRIDNGAGTWLPGPVELTDRVPLPFEVTGVSGLNCNRSGRTVSCSLDFIPSGPTIIQIQAVNRLECVREAGVVPRDNRAKLQFADGSVREAVVEVFYRDCAPTIDGPCAGPEDCMGNELCVRHCEFLQWCQRWLGPICVRHSEYQLFNDPPRCTRPENVNLGITECDRIIR